MYINLNIHTCKHVYKDVYIHTYEDTCVYLEFMYTFIYQCTWLYTVILAAKYIHTSIDDIIR